MLIAPGFQKLADKTIDYPLKQNGRKQPWESIKGSIRGVITSTHGDAIPVESGKKMTTPVGSYSPGGDSPFEIADMAGNVWEWTQSYLTNYPYKPEDDRENLGS